MTLSIWTVYDHPTDFPDRFVARRFVLDRPTDDLMHASDIESLRATLLARGLTKLDRHPTDDPKIVETWL